MKVSTKIMALMVALSAGTTFAASAGTTAGTAIENTANAVFEDPGTPGTTIDIPSNKVTTYVSAIEGFDIMYTAGADGTTATGALPSGYEKPGVLPGKDVVTQYMVVNNSNIDGYVVNLTPDVTNGNLNANTDVKYYLADVNGNRTGNAITSVTLTNGGAGSTVNIVQVITIPSGAAANAQYAASPKGSAPAGTANNGVAYVQYLESQNDPTTGDLQFTRAIIYTPLGAVGPSGFPDASATGTYADPVDTNTTITLSGDTQTAAPKVNDLSTTFINTLKNSGSQSDSFVLSGTGGSTVTFLTPSGQPIGTTATVEQNSNGNNITYIENDDGDVEVRGVPAGQTANFRTVVTYPVTPAQVSVTVGIESTSDNDTAVDNTTTNLVNVPGLLFGDSTPAANGDPDPRKTDPAPLDNPNPSATPGTTAKLNMELKNTGGGAEEFTFTSTTVRFSVVDNDGNISTVDNIVTYFLDSDCDGTMNTGAVGSATLKVTIPAGDSVCAIAQVDVPANATKQTTPQIVQTVTGTSNVTMTDTNDTVTVTVNRTPNPPTPPGPNPYTPNVLIAKFTAKAGYTGTDTAPSGQTNPAGYTTGTVNAKPGDTVAYLIIAKNIYNTSIAKFTLTDSVPTNTTLKSIALFTNNGTRTAAANPIYSTDNGTTWTALSTAPTVTVAGTKYLVAEDDTTVGGLQPAALGANRTLELEFEVTINN